MKAMKFGALLIAASMIVAIGTTWGRGGDARRLHPDAFNVVQGKLYDADGDIVGHFEISWNAKDVGQGWACHVAAKVVVNHVEPLTRYAGRIFIGTGHTCLMGPLEVLLETSPGGTGRSHQVCGWMEMPEEMPTCTMMYLASAITGDIIVSDRIPLLR